MKTFKCNRVQNHWQVFTSVRPQLKNKVHFSPSSPKCNILHTKISLLFRQESSVMLKIFLQYRKDIVVMVVLTVLSPN